MILGSSSQLTILISCCFQELVKKVNELLTKQPGVEKKSESALGAQLQVVKGEGAMDFLAPTNDSLWFYLCA